MPFKTVLMNAVSVYKKNFSKLFVPLLLFQFALLLPLMFFTMPGTVNMARALLVTFESYSRTGGGMSVVLYVLLYVILVLLFLSPLIVSNTVYVVNKDYLNEPVSLKQSMGFARKNYGKMIVSYFSTIALFMPLLFVIWLMLSGMFVQGFKLAELKGMDILFIVISAAIGLLYFLGTAFLPYVVVAEKRSGFPATLLSFRYVYQGNFLNTLSKLIFAGGVVVGLMYAINWLAQLPFAELFDLYMEDPLLALKEPLMLFAVVLSIIAIFLIAFIMPFWYAFSYNTYRGVKLDNEKKAKSEWDEESNIIF